MNNIGASRIRIHPTEVFELRAQGWTLQRLGEKYGVTKVAVSHYLRRQVSRRNLPHVTVACVMCGEPVKRFQRNRAEYRDFCSRDCYYASMGQGYRPWKHGQLSARRTVAAV